MQKQQGFTLIELMIVVAIIGILAAIAIPQYQNYTNRAKVTELIAAGNACKTAVSEYYSSESQFPGSETQAGCEAQSTQYVSSVSVGTGGVITVASNITNATGNYVLTPTVPSAGGAISWSCTASTIDDKFLPANCR
ncbi:fimbrial protein (precursor) [Salinisphaera shabanensis T35B1]|uniref:pilin n=1 Tax=Salinisphaera shabanensis TaxID=180542 RepID=UPI00333FE64F